MVDGQPRVYDMSRIGFMQGRLSEVVDGKIQAFPWDNWKSEFQLAREIQMPLMEWTLDQLDLYKNPLMSLEGRTDIKRLSEKNGLSIPSVTGDCFMQEPFWKTNSRNRAPLVDDFTSILSACGSLGMQTLVIPLVDNGALNSGKEEKCLIDVVERQELALKSMGLKIAFESDYAPLVLARFIDKLNPEFFGINYDVGNSAALGFNVRDEFLNYGQRILNVHIKDRVLGGSTVPLGRGHADFETVFSGLAELNYKGNYILQTARAQSGQHQQVLKDYLKLATSWVYKYGS